jgi:hypothetical protein
MHVIFGQWTTEDVVVVEMSETEWRVSDLRLREDDCMVVLGSVRCVRNRYEATDARNPSRLQTFHSFDAAVDFLSRARLAAI